MDKEVDEVIGLIYKKVNVEINKRKKVRAKKTLGQRTDNIEKNAKLMNVLIDINLEEKSF